MKLISALVFTLLLHYSYSTPCFDAKECGTYSYDPHKIIFKVFNESAEPCFKRHKPQRDLLDCMKPYKIIIHTWRQNIHCDAVSFLKDKYVCAGIYNVILVDWSIYARSIFYTIAGCYSKQVGNTIGNLVMTLRAECLKKAAPRPYVHLIGFSVGAHVAGSAGKYVQKIGRFKIDRITGLNPAKAGFECKNDYRLDKTDAEFVDIIHTENGTLAITDPIGHSDFYPNCGIVRACRRRFKNLIKRQRCHHFYSLYLMAESVDTLFEGRDCANCFRYKRHMCDTEPVGIMGEHASGLAKGTYYLNPSVIVNISYACPAEPSLKTRRT